MKLRLLFENINKRMFWHEAKSILRGQSVKLWQSVAKGYIASAAAVERSLGYFFDYYLRSQETLAARNSGYQRRTATASILRKHQVKLEKI